MLQKDPRLRPGAGEVLYRLALAHDSSVAVALSAVTVAPRRARRAARVVGRDVEMDALLARVRARAARHRDALVVISAEAGVGKTTLVDAFVRALDDRGEAVRVGRGRCSERLAGSEAYLPVLEVLDSLQHHEQLGSLSRLIRAVAPSWYAQIMPPSANDSSAARLAADTAGGSQERLKREIAALLEEVARMQPVVLCFDDVHWADPSTTDLLGYLARRIDDTRLADRRHVPAVGAGAGAPPVPRRSSSISSRAACAARSRRATSTRRRSRGTSRCSSPITRFRAASPR